jgi:hypothetical protein
VERRPAERSPVRVPAGRTVIYCLVPERLAAELLAPLREHYLPEADVKVIVDRRTGAARQPEGNRRRPVVPRQPASALPPELAARARELRWEQRLRPVRRRLQDADLGSLLGLVADGDDDAHSELYWRYANRVRARLVSRLADRHDVDGAMRQTFGRLFDQVAGVEAGSRSFDALVAGVADAVAGEIAALAVT